jgi:hypothetical protein
MFLMLVLNLAEGLCCAWFIYSILCWCRCPEIRSSSIDWAQLSRFYLKTETEFSLRNAVCFKEKTGRWIMSRNTIIVFTCHRHRPLDQDSNRLLHFFSGNSYQIRNADECFLISKCPSQVVCSGTEHQLQVIKLNCVGTIGSRPQNDSRHKNPR